MQQKRHAFLVLAAVTAAMVADSRIPLSPRPSSVPAAIVQKMARLRRVIPVPYGAPGQAQRHYNAKRLPADARIDTRAAYARAEQHVERMPMYSVAEGRYLSSLETRSARAGKSLLRGSWKTLGPGNVGGRTRTLAVDPEEPNVMYAGGVSGGVWKTINGGGAWKISGADMQNIAVNSMAMHPIDPDTLVVGTGEGYFREDVRGTGLPLRGGGVFRTIDAGGSWTMLPGTDGEDFWFVNEILYSRDGGRIYAATRTGVLRSLDDGATWESILETKEKGGCLDLAIRTDRADDVLFASCGTFERATVYRSNSAGGRRATKFKSVLSEPGMGRTSIALAPANQDVIYALAASNSGGTYEQALHAVFRSDAGGSAGSWQATVRNSDPAVHNTWLLHNAVLMTLVNCGFTGPNTVLPMGWYVNAIEVDPVNPDIVWAGGVDWFRSSDGGRNWGPASFWWAGGANPAPSYSHSDQHGLTFHPDYDGAGNQTIFLSNDGGVWRSDNARATVATGAAAACDPANSGVTYRSLNNDFEITQFYHGLPFADGKSFMGGTQDNGTRYRPRRNGLNGWISLFGGDGGYVAIDPDDQDVFYLESQNGNLARTTDGGGTIVSATLGLPPGNGQFLDPGGNFVFITPFVMDPGNSKTLWIGGKQMYRSTNGAVSWQTASKKLKGRATAVAVSPSDSERVAAGTELGFIHFTARGSAANAGTKWSRKRPRRAWVTWVAFDPEDADTIYATYGGFGGAHVFRSTDGGRRWKSIDGAGEASLPDIPVHVIVVDSTNTQRLFLGTDLGVFVSTDGGATWAQENAGFGNIVTESLHLQREGAANVLYAFTHGRGAWRVRVRK